jgi:predicted ArsR family transcriptional regulator
MPPEGITEEVGSLAPIRALSALADETRQRLYGYVVARHEPVSRDQAAAAVGVSRSVAAFHLDRLVVAGLLDVEYRRLGGRSGPGAGRPSKLYRVSADVVEVSLPPRRYRFLAEWLAGALEAAWTEAAGAELRAVAAGYGEQLGRTAVDAVGRRRDRGRLLESAAAILTDAGFGARLDRDALVLDNCPFEPIAERHRSIVCEEMNRTLMSRFSAVLDAGLSVAFEPRPGACCVVLRNGTARRRRPTTRCGS